jgi:hypothetical protein
MAHRLSDEDIAAAIAEHKAAVARLADLVKTLENQLTEIQARHVGAERSPPYPTADPPPPC